MSGCQTSLILGLAAAALACQPAPPGGSAPSVLLVTIDTLRADHVGAYGDAGARTPVLDALAARGTRFATALSAAPVTLPSHASMFTGLFPPRHGARYNGLFQLPESADTFTERLQGAGYATGAVVGAFVLAARFGLAQGFDHYDDVGFEARRGAPGGYLERSATEVTDRALAWLESATPPFFLWVHYFDPHARYRPPSPYAEQFPERPYAGEIAYVDAQLGRLLGALPHPERTLVVATSDHGESLGEHDERTHSYTLYDAALRIPLIVRGPGVPAGRVVEELVRSVDLAATVLEAVGLAAPEGMDGRSLVPLWQGRDPGASRLAFAETLAPHFDHGWSPIFAARTARHLYVKAPRPELYEIATDAGQVHNLLETPDGSARARAEALEAEIAPLLATAPLQPEGQADARTLERLRALGYAVADGPVAPSDVDPKDGLPALRLYNAALAAFEARRLQRAEALLLEVLERLPESPSAHSLMARLRLVQQRYDAALASLRICIERVPRSALYRSLLGDARAGLGDLEGAIQAYERAHELDPDMAPVHVGLMWRALYGASLEETARHAARAAQLMPQDADLRVRIATVWARLGRPERALAAAREAVRIDPGSRRAHLEVAIQLARLGRTAEAEAHLEGAGELLRDLPNATRLAVALAGAGETERAEGLLRELLAAFPRHPGPRRNLAFLLTQTGRGAEAEALRRATP